MKIEIDSEKEQITLNGITVSFAALSFILDPNPDKLLRFRRAGDVIMVTERRYAGDAHD